MLFHWGYNTKLKHLQEGRPYDKVVKDWHMPNTHPRHTTGGTAV